MMINFFILLLVSSSLQAAVSVNEAAHPFYLLPKNEYALHAFVGYFEEEHEYEKSGIVHDIFNYDNLSYHVGSKIGFGNLKTAGLDLEFQSHGQLSKTYSPLLNLPPQNIEYSGFRLFELFFQQHLQTINPKNKLAVEARVKGSPVKAKETNSSYGGYDFALSYLYSHLHDEWQLYGKLKAEIIGSKKILKYGDEIEQVSAYSLFGNMLGLQWLQSKFWIDVNVLFYLTTDYRSTSASYVRLTDKGFVIGGKLAFGYLLNNASTVVLEHSKSSSSFNVITELIAEEHEFEIENDQTQLGVTWFF